MAIKQKNIYHKATYGYKLTGYATTEANYLLLDNRSAAEEGDSWYDTTNNLLKTYDGSNWSPAGINSMSAGTLNAVAALGNTITIDGSTVTAGTVIVGTTVASGALLFLNNDDTSNDPVCLNIDNEANASDAVSIQIDGQAGYDIQGTSNSWDVAYNGDAMFHDIWVKDDLGVQFGTASSKAGDVSVLFHEGAVGTAGNGLLFDAVGSDENLQFGDATYSFDVRFIGEGSTDYHMLWDLNGGTNSLGALIFDNSDLMLGDNDELIFGDVSDWVIDWDDTSLSIIPAANNSPIIWGSATRGVNFSIYGDTATSILEWNAANDKLVYKSAASSTDVAVQLDDFCQLTFGTGANFGTTGSGDVQFSRDSVDFHLSCTADGEVWNIGTGSLDFDIKWFASSTGDYVLFDEGNARVEFVDVDLRFNDDGILYFGTTSDASLQWDNTNNTLDITGNVDITGTLSVSGAFDIGNFAFADDEELRFGDTSGGDFILTYDSSADNLQLDAAAANNAFDIGANTNTDVVFHGGNGGYDLWWDANTNNLFVLDNAILSIGTDGDIDIKSDNTNYSIDAGSANGLIDIGLAVDTDMRWHGATETEDIHWDASEDTLCIISGAVLGFGNTAASPDFEFTYDGTSFLVEPATQNDDMNWGATTNFNFTISCDTNTNYFKFDTDDTAKSLDLRNTHLIFEDGTATFDFINTSQVLLIEPDQDDRVIAFGRTNQVDVEFNGNDADYDMYWDASANGCLFKDNAILAIGATVASPDLKIYSDGTSTAITLGVASTITGEALGLTFGISGTHGMDVVFQGATTGDNITFDAGNTTLTLTDSTLVFNPTTSAATVDYTFDASADALKLTATDSQSAALTLGTSGTNGMDVIFQSKTTGDHIKFDAGALSLTFQDTTQVFASGGTVAYTLASASDVMTLTATDSQTAKITLGASSTHGLDVVFQSAETANMITFDAAALSWTFGGTSANNIDVVFNTGTSGDNITFNAGNKTLTFTDSTQVFASVGTVSYTLGSALDIMALSATDSQTAALTIGTSGTHGLDVVFQSAVTGDNITFDAASKTLTATDCEIVCETEPGAGGSGLAIPLNATTSPSTTNATGGRMVFETDLNKLWVKTATTGTWVGIVLS